MPQLDVRPGNLGLVLRPGNSFVLEMAWDNPPTGELTAVLGDDTALEVDGPDDDGVVTVEFTADVTEGLTGQPSWSLLEDGQTLITGQVSPSNMGTERQRLAVDVVTSTAQVSVTAAPGAAPTGPGGETDLGYTASPTGGTVTSSTGDDAPIPAASGTNAGLMLPAEKTKLAGVATGATANSSDAALLARANHTGTQPASSISDFATAADVRIAAIVVKAFVDALNVDAATLEGETVASLTTLITAAIVDSAPGALNTLNELAAALGDDPNFATTIATALGNKAAIDGSNVTAATWRTVLDVLSSGQVTTAISNAIAGLSGTYAPIAEPLAVHLTGNETVAGTKTFSSAPVVPDSSFAIAKTTGLQAALDLKATLASPTFTGTPAAPTASAGTSTTQVATTAFVQTEKLVGIPSDKTADYTLVLTDQATSIGVDSASAKNVTVPPNSSVAFPVGALVEVRQVGAGQVTIVAGSGVTLRSAGAALKARAQYSAVSLLKVATDTWSVQGDVTT